MWSHDLIAHKGYTDAKAPTSVTCTEKTVADIAEAGEWLKEHAWKLLWRSATVCCRFRLPLRSQPLNGDRVTSVDHRKPR